MKTSCVPSANVKRHKFENPIFSKTLLQKFVVISSLIRSFDCSKDESKLPSSKLVFLIILSFEDFSNFSEMSDKANQSIK